MKFGTREFILEESKKPLFKRVGYFVKENILISFIDSLVTISLDFTDSEEEAKESYNNILKEYTEDSDILRRSFLDYLKHII
jgi:hypothetical protein